MKTQYPKYKQGDLEVIEGKLSVKNKKIIKDFLNNCQTTITSENKLGKVKRVLLQFYDITERDLDKQDKESINGFLIVLNKSDRAGWTKHETKVYVKKFLKGFYKDLDLIENIKSNKRDKVINISESDLITEQEFERILENTNLIKSKALLTLAYESGARPQEILNLKWRDLVFEDKCVNVTLYSNKTGQTRVYPVVRAKNFLWNWKNNFQFANVKNSDYIFPNPMNRDKPITSVALNKIIKKASLRAGLKKDVWAYLFRHSNATKLYEKLPQPICEKLLGHKNMSHVYAHISNKTARDTLLNEIYSVEDLPESEREKYGKEIESLKSQIKDLYENMAKIGTQIYQTQGKRGEVKVVKKF